MKRKLMAASALALVAVAGLAIAQIAPRVSADPNTDVMIERLHQGSVIEQFVAQQVAPLRSADRDGDGLDRDDVALAVAQQRAQMRAGSISQVLMHDLDGDFRVTRSELERSATGDEEYRSRNVDTQLEQFDANGDDVITLEEAAVAREERFDGQLEALIKLDPNGDGVLTAEELRKLAERTFESVDRDRDGKISAGEHRAIADRVRNIQLSRSAPVCNLPPVADRSRLVVYGGYEGDSISTVAIGGPEQETNLIDVAIEPGSQPLYLVLTSYESMVWRLTGATDRIDHVVVSSSASAPRRQADAKPTPGGGTATGPRAAAGIGWSGSGKASASGVVGVPARKVTISTPGCPGYFHSSEAGRSIPILTTLRRSLGREPDAIIGSYTAQQVSLPSGQITHAKRDQARLPRGFDPVMWADAARYWPGGLVLVDPRRVVARARVEPYKVLPSQMGLSQLIGSGAIERAPNGRLRIVRPIPRMPPSMGGAHSVTLVLAKGVPMPPGNPGHSCVISEDNGTSRGAVCQGRE